jgi:hypothetical protein
LKRKRRRLVCFFQPYYSFLHRIRPGGEAKGHDNHPGGARRPLQHCRLWPISVSPRLMTYMQFIIAIVVLWRYAVCLSRPLFDQTSLTLRQLGVSVYLPPALLTPLDGILPGL